MAHNVNVMGAIFPDVPSVLLPDQNDVLHAFTDVSDTTATASDVAQGVWFYTAAGVRTVGTSQGGGTDGDDLAYGGAYGGTAIVGSAVLAS